jgi:hypothetical protein
MLSLFLDENISYEVSRQIVKKRPEMFVVSLYDCEGGRLLGASDERILREITPEGWTFVTYDATTIPTVLKRFAEAGFSHNGILFVDRSAIPSHDFGKLVTAILDYWEQEKESDWRDRIVFLPPPKSNG